MWQSDWTTTASVRLGKWVTLISIKIDLFSYVHICMIKLLQFSQILKDIWNPLCVSNTYRFLAIIYSSWWEPSLNFFRHEWIHAKTKTKDYYLATGKWKKQKIWMWLFIHAIPALKKSRQKDVKVKSLYDLHSQFQDIWRSRDRLSHINNAFLLY